MEPIGLIVSERCQHSQKLIEMIKADDTLSKVTKVFFIEKYPAPKGVSSVPTIIEKDRFYEGKDAFDFVEEKINSAMECFEFDSRMVGNSGWSFLGNGESPQVGAFSFLTTGGFESDNKDTQNVDNNEKDDRLQRLIDERNQLM